MAIDPKYTGYRIGQMFPVDEAELQALSMQSSPIGLLHYLEQKRRKNGEQVEEIFKEWRKYNEA